VESTPIELTEPIRLLVAGTGVMNLVPSFFGVAALALAVVAVVGRRPRAAFLMTVAVVAFLASLGAAGGLHQWLRLIPPFGFFRSPVKFHALAEFGVAWTAALGADTLRRVPRGAWRTALLGLAVAALVERRTSLASFRPSVRSRARRSHARRVRDHARGAAPRRAPRRSAAAGPRPPGP
jgi:hypothetical protein